MHRVDRGVEQATRAALGLDELRVRRIGLDLAPQAKVGGGHGEDASTRVARDVHEVARRASTLANGLR